MAGRLTDKTDRQTEIATKSDSTKRGWETKGGTSKTKEQSSGGGRRAFCRWS